MMTAGMVDMIGEDTVHLKRAREKTTLIIHSKLLALLAPISRFGSSPQMGDIGRMQLEARG